MIEVTVDSTGRTITYEGFRKAHEVLELLRIKAMDSLYDDEVNVYDITAKTADIDTFLDLAVMKYYELYAKQCTNTQDEG